MLLRVQIDLLRHPAVVTTEGLFVYRSKLFGGMSAEVLTIFSKSNLMACLKGIEIPAASGSFSF